MIRVDNDAVIILIRRACDPHTTINDAMIAGVPSARRASDRIVEYYADYAAKLSSNMCRKIPYDSRVEHEDMRAAALLGLVEAVNSYDITRGVMLTTHIWNRVRKRVNQEIIASHWHTLKPPKNMAEKYLGSGLDPEKALDYHRKCMQVADYEYVEDGLDDIYWI